MKAKNYEASHYGPFTSYYYLLPIMSKTFSTYGLITKTRNINNPFKNLALKDSCRITGWKVLIPNNAACR